MLFNLVPNGTADARRELQSPLRDWQNGAQFPALKRRALWVVPLGQNMNDLKLRFTGQNTFFPLSSSNHLAKPRTRTNQSVTQTYPNKFEQRS
jgi:hypothetical protein